MASYVINIQSISDIITNSSSEVFCKIYGDEDVINSIKEYLSRFIGTFADPELEPYMALCEKEDGTKFIQIELPYSYPKEFFEAGLDAILEKNFNNYIVDYDPNW